MTHQRHFLPHCDHILVLKDGYQLGLGTYSELASSALTELTQLEQETELDDAVYDEQIPNRAASQLTLEQSGPDFGSALQAMNAGPIQARFHAEVPAAAVVASQTADAADHLTTGQQLDACLATSVPSDSLAMLATAATATTAVAAAGNGSHTAPTGPATAGITNAVQREVVSTASGIVAAESNPAGLNRSPQGQGHKEQATFCPAHVVKKKVMLPPRVDQRWGPEKLCEKWYHRIRGISKANKPKDEGFPEEEVAGKEQAQLNQQEGCATGKVLSRIEHTHFEDHPFQRCSKPFGQRCRPAYVVMQCGEEYSC